MLTDAQARLFFAQPITSAGTYVGQAYDVELNSNTPRRNLAAYGLIRLKVTCENGFAGGSGLTLNYVQSDNNDLSGSTVLASTAISGAPSTGLLWDIVVPANTQRYVGMTVVSTGTYSAGTLSANLVANAGADRSDQYYAANTGF